jgi:hypothetical protein
MFLMIASCCVSITNNTNFTVNTTRGLVRISSGPQDNMRFKGQLQFPCYMCNWNLSSSGIPDIMYIYNLLTYVPLHVSTIIGSSSGIVIYTFSLLNRKACIHVFTYIDSK